MTRRQEARAERPGACDCTAECSLMQHATQPHHVTCLKTRARCRLLLQVGPLSSVGASARTSDGNTVAGAGAVELAVVLQLQVAVEDIKLWSSARPVRLRHLLGFVVQVWEWVPCASASMVKSQERQGSEHPYDTAKNLQVLPVEQERAEWSCIAVWLDKLQTTVHTCTNHNFLIL